MRVLKQGDRRRLARESWHGSYTCRVCGRTLVFEPGDTKPEMRLHEVIGALPVVDMGCATCDQITTWTGPIPHFPAETERDHCPEMPDGECRELTFWQSIKWGFFGVKP